MKVMTALFGPTDAIERAHVLREAGASGVFNFEGPHDVFTPLALAAAVEDLDLMTNVAIAFPRNPIHLAHQANDLQLLTKGRFTGRRPRSTAEPLIVVLSRTKGGWV